MSINLNEYLLENNDVEHTETAEHSMNQVISITTLIFYKTKFNALIPFVSAEN